MGRFRIGGKEISLILDRTIQDGELLFENEQNNEAPAKLFVDSDGKLKFRNRNEDPRFIGDGTGSGSSRSIIQGDRDPNEYHNMPSSVGLTEDQIDYYNDVKSALVGDSYIDNENFILYVKKREFQQGLSKVWIQRGSAFKGEDGEPTINGILTNEMHTVVSTTDGVVSDDLSTAGGRFTVYDGTSYATGVTFKASIDGNTFAPAGAQISSSGVRLVIDSSGYYTLSLAPGGWNRLVNTVTFVLRAEVGALVIDKFYTITKSKGGGLLRLTADRQAFTRDGQGNFAPAQQTVKLTAQLINLSSDAQITWTIFKLNPSNAWVELPNPEFYLSIFDNIATIDEQKFGDALIAYSNIGTAIKIKATVDAIFDEMTIITVADGAQGEVGESPYHGILTNESHTVPSKEDGTAVIGLGIVPSNKAGGFYRIYEGTSLLNSGVIFTAVGAGSSVDGISSIVQNGLRLEVNTSTGEYSLFEVSQDSWISDSETFSIRAEINDVNIDKTYTIVKSKGGANAKLLYLYSDRQTITVDGDGSLAPQTQSVRFSVKLQNITSNTVTWTLEKDVAGDWLEVANATDYLSAISTTGDSNIILSLTQEKYNTLFSGGVTLIRVTAAADGFDDSISITTVKDGARGIAYSGNLSNESHLVAASYEGVVTDSLENAGGYFVIYEGAEIYTGATFSVHESPIGEGISAQIDNATGQYTISQTNWSTDTATFTFRGTIGTSGEFIDKKYTITKSKAGAQGEPAKLIYLSSTSQTFKKDGTNSYSPPEQVVEFRATLQNMSTTSATWEIYRRVGSTFSKIEDVTGMLSTSDTTATMTQTQYTLALGSGSQITVRAIAEGLSDDISISTINDGTDGAGSYNAFLTNESHIVAADVTGIVSNNELENSGAGGSFIVFEGTQERSADYSIVGGVSAGSYYEKKVDGLTCRIDKFTGEYEVFQDTGDVWLATSKSVSFTLAASIGSSTIQKVFGVSKSLAGANGESAKIVYLTTDAQSFTLDGDGNLSPSDQVITFNASLQNITSSAVTWGVSRWVTTPVPGWSALTMPDVAFLTPDNTSATMTYAQFNTALGSGRFVKVRASVDSELKDDVTIVKLQDGSAGKNAINGLLTNESHTVVADSDGSNVQGLTTAGGQFVVYVGDEAVTSGVTYEASTNGVQFHPAGTSVNESGLSITISTNGTYSLSLTPGSSEGWISDTAVFQLKGSVSGYPSIIKTYTITKSKGGINAKLLYLSTDRLAFTKNSSGAYSPTSQIVNFTVSKQNLNSLPVEWDAYKLVGTVWTQLTGSLSQYLTTTNDSATMDQSQFNLAAGGTNSVKITAECDGVSDEVSILFVADGAKGADGANGIDGQDGTPGADGLNAKSVKLISTYQQVSYNSAGGNPNPTTIELTVTGSNLSPGTTYQFLSGTSIVQDKSLDDTYTITLGDFDTTFAGGAPLSYRVKAYEGNLPVADDIITIVGTKEGASAITAVLTNSTHAFTADSSGAITSEYSDGATGIFVYEGNNALSATTNATLSNGQFRVSASPVNISVSSGVVQLDGKEIVFTPSLMQTSALSAKITYTIYVKDSNGTQSTLTQVQTFSKSKAGIAGASGSSAKIVKLESTKYQLPYNSAGSPSSPGTFTLTATAQNHTPNSYVFEYSTNGGSSYSTVTSSGNGATVTIPSSYFSIPLIYRVITLDESSTQISQDSITIIATKDGASSLTPVLTNSTHAFPADNNGTISSGDYALGATDIYVYEGNTALTPVSSSTSLTGQTSKFKVVATANGIDVSSTLDTTNKKNTFTPTNDTMTGNTASVSYLITAVDSLGIQYTYTQIQTFSKSKTGEDAKTVALETTSQQISYDASNILVSSSQITLTATPINHTPASYKFEYSQDQGDTYTQISNTSNSAILNVPNTYFSLPIICRVTTLDANESEISKSSITISAVKNGSDGSSTILATLSKNNPVYTVNPYGYVEITGSDNVETTLEVFDGDTPLIPVPYESNIENGKYYCYVSSSGGPRISTYADEVNGHYIFGNSNTLTSTTNTLGRGTNYVVRHLSYDPLWLLQESYTVTPGNDQFAFMTNQHMYVYTATPGETTSLYNLQWRLEPIFSNERRTLDLKAVQTYNYFLGLPGTTPPVFYVASYAQARMYAGLNRYLNTYNRELSISFLFKLNESQNSRVIECINSDNSSNVWYVNFLDYKIEFGVSGGNIRTTTTNACLNPNIWHHVVITYEDSGSSNIRPENVKIYVDGVLISVTSTTTTNVNYPFASPSSISAFSRYIKIGGNNINAAISSLLFFNRRLTLTQIQDLYDEEFSGGHEIPFFLNNSSSFTTQLVSFDLYNGTYDLAPQEKTFIDYNIVGKNLKGQNFSVKRNQNIKFVKRSRESLFGVGAPGTILNFTKTDWQTFAAANFSLSNADADEDYDEVLSASLGDRYLDISTSRTWEKTTEGATGTSSWTQKSRGLLDQVRSQLLSTNLPGSLFRSAALTISGSGQAPVNFMSGSGITIKQSNYTTMNRPAIVIERGSTTTANANLNQAWGLWVSGAYNTSVSGDVRLEFIYSNGHPSAASNVISSKGYISSTTTGSNLNFTGQHRVVPKDSKLFEIEYVGSIVKSDGVYDNTFECDSSVTINEALPIVSLTSNRNEKSVFGVISEREDENITGREYRVGNFVSIFDKKSNDERRLIVNALGEGGIWVTNINGNLENGDYITSCEIPGYGMRQDDDILHSYTVAKITCDCDFNLNSQIYRCEEFEWEGQTYRRAFVGCTYHCG